MSSLDYDASVTRWPWAVTSPFRTASSSSPLPCPSLGGCEVMCPHGSIPSTPGPLCKRLRVAPCLAENHCARQIHKYILCQVHSHTYTVLGIFIYKQCIHTYAHTESGMLTRLHCARHIHMHIPNQECSHVHTARHIYTHTHSARHVHMHTLDSHVLHIDSPSSHPGPRSSEQPATCLLRFLS